MSRILENPFIQDPCPIDTVCAARSAIDALETLLAHSKGLNANASSITGINLILQGVSGALEHVEALLSKAEKPA
ncbi:MAG: hypothetical protein HQL76_02500 [Magnetococcales bacterium]|nr:hypothetical protein [Magnetococcales bacterium]